MFSWIRSPSFFSFVAAIRLAKEKISQLEFSINYQLDIAIKSNINFDVDRAPESIRCRELQGLINRLQEEAKAKNKSKVPEKTNHEDKGKGNKLIESLPFDISPISKEEERETAPVLVKRKRTSPVSRAKHSSAPQISSAPTTAAALSNATLKSGLAPNPDEDDHLTIKILKIQHSQGSGLHALTSHTPVQPPKPVQSVAPVQSAIPTSFPPIIMELEDSDEEQSLRGH